MGCHSRAVRDGSLSPGSHREKGQGSDGAQDGAGLCHTSPCSCPALIHSSHMCPYVRASSLNLMLAGMSPSPPLSGAFHGEAAAGWWGQRLGGRIRAAATISHLRPPAGTREGWARHPPSRRGHPPEDGDAEANVAVAIACPCPGRGRSQPEAVCRSAHQNPSLCQNHLLCSHGNSPPSSTRQMYPFSPTPAPGGRNYGHHQCTALSSGTGKGLQHPNPREASQRLPAALHAGHLPAGGQESPAPGCPRHQWMVMPHGLPSAAQTGKTPKAGFRGAAGQRASLSRTAYPAAADQQWARRGGERRRERGRKGRGDLPQPAAGLVSASAPE